MEFHFVEILRHFKCINFIWIYSILRRFLRWLFWLNWCRFFSFFFFGLFKKIFLFAFFDFLFSILFLADSFKFFLVFLQFTLLRILHNLFKFDKRSLLAACFFSRKYDSKVESFLAFLLKSSFLQIWTGK